MRTPRFTIPIFLVTVPLLVAAVLLVLSGAQSSAAQSPIPTPFPFQGQKEALPPVSVTGVNGIPSQETGQILFTSGPTWDQPHDIYVMNEDGTNVRRLTNGPGSSVDGKFSPDGSKIVFASNRTGSWYIYTMSADGTNVRQLAPAATWSTIDSASDWSPDGTMIAYVCRTGGICVMNMDGTNTRQLTLGYDHVPRWSHDGTRIAYFRYVSGSYQYNYEVYVMNADGSNQVNVTNSPNTCDWLPDWSPDDSKIAFTRWTTPYEEYIYVMNADGTDAHAVTGNEYNSHAVWSHDVYFICFY